MGITKRVAPIKFGISPLISPENVSPIVSPTTGNCQPTTAFCIPDNRQLSTDNYLKAEVCAYCAATDPRPAGRYRRNT